MTSSLMHCGALVYVPGCGVLEIDGAITEDHFQILGQAKYWQKGTFKIFRLTGEIGANISLLWPIFPYRRHHLQTTLFRRFSFHFTRQKK